jgi:hypothetical protein
MLSHLRAVVTIGAIMPDLGGQAVEHRVSVQGDTQEELRRFALRKFRQAYPHAEGATVRKVDVAAD